MQLSNTISRMQSGIDELVHADYWTIALGVARTSLAIGLLLTLLFNSNETLFHFGLQNQIDPVFSTHNIFSIYNLIANFTIAKYISIAILALVISGVYPRYTCILQWWVTYSFVTTSFVIDGGDQINSILTFMLIPLCITDSRKSHWLRSEQKSNSYIKSVIGFFSLLIIQIQVAFVYFHAAVGKFAVAEWVNGTAVYYWFTNQLFGMNEKMYPVIYPILTNTFTITFLTWGVLAFEMFLFSCLFIKNEKVKRFAWYSGIAFHLGIVIIHGLASFFFSMLAALTLLLVTKHKMSKIKQIA